MSSSLDVSAVRERLYRLGEDPLTLVLGGGVPKRRYRATSPAAQERIR
jgi:hypothetical protein